MTERVKGAKKAPGDSSGQGPLLAEGQEPIERTPVALEPAEAEEPLATAANENADAAEAERVLPDRAKLDDRELTLEFGVLRPESQEFRHCGRAKTSLVKIGKNCLTRHVSSVVDKLAIELDCASSLDREVLGRDVRVYPVVATGGDHLLEREVVVHGDGIDLLASPQPTKRLLGAESDDFDHGLAQLIASQC